MAPFERLALTVARFALPPQPQTIAPHNRQFLGCVFLAQPGSAVCFYSCSIEHVRSQVWRVIESDPAIDEGGKKRLGGLSQVRLRLRVGFNLYAGVLQSRHAPMHLKRVARHLLN